MANNYLITGYWGEPHVTAENDRGIHAATFGTGRFVLPISEQFKAEYIGNNTIRMYDGKLMDNGAAAGIPAGEYVDFLISNAGQGMKRNDLIVFQYHKDPSTLIEKGTFIVLQGTETTGTPDDPELTQEDLLSGDATFDQMALWRVTVSGTSIAEPVKVFELCHKNFTEPGQCAKQYSASTLNDFNELINELTDTMDVQSTNCCLISKSVWDDGDNIPSGDYFVEINKSWHGYATVIATIGCAGNQHVLRRILYENTWGDWEWENPRMTPNVEYRTTEKWNGKPVYTQLLPIGSWAKGGTLDFDISPHVIRYSGIIGNWSLPFINNTTDNAYSVWATFYNNGGKLRLGMCGGTNADGSGGHIQIWYYKL